MIFAFVLIAIAFVVAGVVISRLGSREKKKAIAGLENDRQTLHTPSILELVDQEVRESGITDLPGAEGLDSVILLRVWKRDREDCDEGEQRFVVVEGVDPSDATEADVTFECG
ncbi:MAG: hypothetical protein U9R47_08305 [Actinomycetota bacterium]|nr:hypothetical protein [Actinomycetota bacterium]